MEAEIGILGGTGIYDPKLLRNSKEIKIDQPYGEPSDSYLVGDFKGRRVAFLPRHGKQHTIPPHQINFKANIYGFKQLGVKRIIACCAAGSLKEEYRPGDIVIPDQFIDFRKSRTTFYDDKVAHVSLADPFCPELRKGLIEACEYLGITYHETGTYLCIEGPRFSTRAESRMFRTFADLIGMTGAPEGVLAREMELCFAILATVTDYDVWAEKPVSVEEIKQVMQENLEKVKSVIETVIPKISKERNCFCKNALENAFM